jgi:hypothetical protein
MTELQEKQLAFLEETAGFYNSKNRALGSDGECIYSSTAKSPGCAIGRHLSPELAINLDTRSETGISNDDVFRNMPPSLKELGQPFLGRVQMLHDDSTNWDDTGLSSDGESYVIRIKEIFKLV